MGNKKAKLWVNGRQNWQQKMKAAIQPNDQPIWIHASSLGEFEQGRPVMEALKKEYPNQKILLTFYSPSGYEIRKNYNQVDYVFYLPSDTPANARQLLDIIQPKFVIWVKYDFWWHILNEIKRRGIDSYLIAALVREDQFENRFYKNILKNSLQTFSHIFTQNETATTLLQRHQIHQVTTTGDPRIDRVFQISQQSKRFLKIEEFIGNDKVLIVGSAWREEMEILKKYLMNYGDNLKFKIIIAPHEIGEENIKWIVENCPIPCVRYSDLRGKHLQNFQSLTSVLIIDNIGMLAHLYQYGWVAYIGGGHKTGLHNTLEPAAFGLPLIFGNKTYHKFEEAIYFAKNGGAFPMESWIDFEETIQKLQAMDFYKKSAAITRQYIEQYSGATRQILSYLKN